jgi:ADP-heptose:LPS heptosyltransferase
VTKRLLILPNNPGDVLMGLHAAAALKARHPSDSVAFAVDSECAILVRDNPCVDLCLEIPRKAIRAKNSRHQAAPLLDAFLQQCQNYGADIVINLFQGDYGAILSALIPASRHLGKYYDPALGRIVVKDPWSQYLWAIPAHRLANPLHVVDIFLRICNVTSPTPPRLLLPAIPSETTAALQQQLPDQPFIAFQPGSAVSGKQWPLAHWIRLGQLLCAHSSCSIVLLGAPQESALCAALAAQLPAHRIHNLCGKTTLLSVKCLLERARLLLCGDTFAMHLASALRIPVLALFGPSNPIETGPYQPGAQVLQSSAPALGQNLFSEHTASLETITPEFVFDVIQGNRPPAQLRQSYWSHQHLQWTPSPGTQTDLTTPLSIDLPEQSGPHMLLLRSQAQQIQDLLTGMTPLALAELSRREQEIARITDQSIGMEMYRMALNALPSAPLHDHLRLRLQLVNDVLAVLR